MKKIIIPVLSLFLIFSCDMLPSPDKKKDEPTKFENILNSYSNALTNDLNEEQRKTLLTNATAAAGEVTSEDSVVLVPLAVETIIGSLSELSLTSQEKIDVVNEISSKSVDIIKSEINTTSRSSRNIDLTKLKEILNRVAKSIVKSVPASGILEEDYSKANESSVNNLVSSLGDSDIPEENITELSQTVTEGAVSQLSESKNDYINVENEIVKSISQGAVKGIANIESTTIKKEELIQDVTKAALNAVKELETDSAKVTILIIVVTDGTTEGINDVKDKLGDETVVEAIKGISKETIESVKTLELSDEEMKEKVSELSSQINDKVATNLPEIDNTEALKAVVSGIASGAQEISNEFQNIETLKETISIKDSDNNKIDLTDLEEVINEGISQGQEEKKEEANTEDKEILEALSPISDSMNEIKKAINLGSDANQDELNKLNNILTLLTTVTEKYPENELLGEAYFRITELYRLLYQLNKDEENLTKAIEAAIKASNDYDNTSWYAYEAALLLRIMYTYDSKEFDKSIAVATSIATKYGEKSEHIIRSKHDIMDTYWQQLYTDYDWKNRFGDSTEFLTNTYIPAIEDVLNTEIDYSGNQAWVIRVAHERRAETFTWLDDLEGAINYCFELIAELETSSIPEEVSNIFQANLYQIAGKFLREKSGDWPENKLELIEGAIEALEEGLKLSYNNGVILDRWVYVHNLETLMSSYAQKSYWYAEVGEFRDSIFFNMERRLLELVSIARNIGDDHQGQYAHILSYTHEGRFYMNMGNAYRNDDLNSNYLDRSERSDFYYKKAAAALEKGLEIRNDFYFIEGNWVAEGQALDLVPVYLNLYGYEKAITFYNEITQERAKADWVIGGMLSDIADYAVLQISKLDITKDELQNWFQEITKVQTVAKKVFDSEPREWYSKEIKNGFTQFYFIYFIFMRSMISSPEMYENQNLIDARHNAIHFGKPENYVSTPYFGKPDEWYHMLFDDEANKYGDTVLLDGGVNVIIK